MIFMGWMLLAMDVLAAAAALAWLMRAPLMQTWHLGQRAAPRTAMTATVVRPALSLRPLSGGQRAAIRPVRIIRGEIER